MEHYLPNRLAFGGLKPVFDYYFVYSISAASGLEADGLRVARARFICAFR